VPGVVQKWVLHGQSYSNGEAFQKARLLFLDFLEKHAKTNLLIRNELPYFKFHAFFMRGIYFEKRDMLDLAYKEYIKAIKSRPINFDGYYLLIKLLIKKTLIRSGK